MAVLELRTRGDFLELAGAWPETIRITNGMLLTLTGEYGATFDGVTSLLDIRVLDGRGIYRLGYSNGVGVREAVLVYHEPA